MTRGPLHHVSLEISDVVRAQFFYDRFLLPLGFKRFVASDAYLGYTDGGMTLWLLKSPKPRIHRHPPSGDEEVIAEHLAFRVPSAGSVREREKALAQAEIYPIFPGEEHPEFRAGYFSAVWVDPDGIVLELYAVEGKGGGPHRRSARSGRARAKRARRPAARRGRAAR